MPPLGGGRVSGHCCVDLIPHLAGDHPHYLLALPTLAFVVSESFSHASFSSTTPITYDDINVTVIINSQYL